MDDYKYIRRVLKRKAYLARTFFLLNGLLLVLILGLVLIGLGVGLSMIIPSTGKVFVGYGIFSWMLMLLSSLMILLLFFRPLDIEKTACRFEERYPDLNSELISALQLGRRQSSLAGSLGLSRGMIKALTAKIRRQLPEISKKPIVDREFLYRNLFLLAVILMTSVAAAGFQGGRFNRVLSVMANPIRALRLAAPGLEVTPGDVRLLEGEPLDVRARLTGGRGGRLSVEMRSAEQPQRLESIAMKKTGPESFSLTIPGVVESLLYRVVHPGAASPWYTASVSPVPKAGDIRLILTYPAYTGLQPEIQEGSGHMKCFKGTVVRWQARANKPLAEASLVMADGEVQPLLLGEDRIINGEFIVTSGGPYRVILRDREGFAGGQPDEYDIRLLPDEFPVVELLIPQEDLELDSAALVDVYFAARDDFGLMDGTLVCTLEDGRTSRIRLPGGMNRSSYQAGYSWDLGELGLEPGQRLDFHVEVLDNDSISGPKAGVSMTRSIRIKDSRAIHDDLAELGRELNDDLVDLLGDELEIMGSMEEMEEMSQVPEEQFASDLDDLASFQKETTDKFDRTMQKMDDYLAKMSEDFFSEPSSVYMKVLARQMLQKVLEGEKTEGEQMEGLSLMDDMPLEDMAAEMGWMAKEKEKRISQMEQAVKFLQESSRYQNMEEAISQQEDMIDLQRDLMDKLEGMEDALTEDIAGELAEMIHEIGRMLTEMMEKLTSMQDDFPEEFINSDALTEVPFNDLMETLREMAEALSQGDLEKAKRKAEELLQQMSELLERLREAAGNYKDLSRMGIDDFQQKRVSELSKLVEEQRSLLRKTETMSGVMTGRLADKRREKAEQLNEAVERAVTYIRKKLYDLKVLSDSGGMPEDLGPRVLPSMNKELNDLQVSADRMKKENIEKAMKSIKEKADEIAEILRKDEGPAEPIRASLRNVEEILGAIDEAEDSLRQAELSESEAVLPGEKESLEAMAAEQKGLEGRTGELRKKLEVLAKMFPMITPELIDSLKEAAGFMGGAEERLSDLLPGKAVPFEREALYHLMQARNSAMQASGQMGRMSRLRQGGRGARSEAEQLFGLVPGFVVMPGTGEKEGGRAGASVRNFKIPGSQEFEVPRVFREEIMESMKAGYPQMFEKAIRQYYRNITE